MKKLIALFLLIPSLAFAGNYSGTATGPEIDQLHGITQINITQSPYNASGFIVKTTTSGSVSSGTTNIPVTSSARFSVGHVVVVVLAGSVSGNTTSHYAGFISAIPDGTHITVSATAVTGASLPPSCSGSTTGTQTTVPAGYPVYELGSTTTSGTTSPGTSVVLANAASYQVGHGILITGAGAAGVDYVGTISNVNSNTLTITPTTSTSVVTGTNVQHDETGAFQTAITAVGNLGTGKIIVPDGFYQINGPLQDTGSANAILLMPKIHYFSGTIPGAGLWSPMVTIDIEGITPVPFNNNYLAYQTIPTLAGTIIQTSRTAGNLIGGNDAGVSLSDFTNVQLAFKNLQFRTYPNPSITVINAMRIASLATEYVNFDTGTSGLPVQPTNSNGVAIRAPYPANAGNNKLSYMDFTGYYTDIIATEHTILSQIRFDGNLYGIVFAGGGYGSYADRLYFNACTYGITANATQPITFTSINFEHQTVNAWATTTYDINDPSNYLQGTLGYDTSGLTTLLTAGAAQLQITKLSQPFPFLAYDPSFGTYQGSWFLWPTTSPTSGQILKTTTAGPSIGGNIYTMNTSWISSFQSNLVSSNFAAWSLNHTTVTSNSTGAVTPDGSYGAAALVEDSVTGTPTHWLATTNTNLVNNANYTESVYVKAIATSGANARDLSIYDEAGNGVTVMLSGTNCTGNTTPFACCTAAGVGASCAGQTYVLTGSPVGYTNTAVGNGWYKFTTTFKAAGGTPATLAMALWLTKANAGNYNGNSAGGVYIWKPQMVAGVNPEFSTPSSPLVDGSTFSSGAATCWKTGGVLGYCSSIVGAGGTCTCN